MPDAASPTLPMLSRRSSRFFGAYTGGIFCSPIWYAIGALVFSSLPMGMTMSWLNGLQEKQFGKDAYWLTTMAAVTTAIVSAPVIGVIGYLSQPHRFGRKRVMLYLMLVSSIQNAVPAVTTNAYTIVISQLISAVFGCDRSNTGLFVTVTAWCTDWCNPADKAKYFGIIMGCMFGTLAFSPMVPKWFGIYQDEEIAMFSALLKLIGPFFVLAFFPNAVATVEPASPATFSRQFSASQDIAPSAMPAVSAQSGFSARKSLNHVCESVRYLFTMHFAATCIYLMVNFTDSAIQDTIMIYLIKERGFTKSDLNDLIFIIGIFGFFIQCIGVPVVTQCGVRPQSLLVVAVLAMMVHFAVYAFCANKLVVILAEPIGSLGYVATISSMAIVSGTSEKDNIPRDQGTLLGTLSALKLIASCIGPFLLAGCTTYWRSFPAPLNWPGIGYAILSVLMFLTWGLAIKTWFSTISAQGAAGAVVTNCCCDDTPSSLAAGSIVKPEAAC